MKEANQDLEKIIDLLRDRNIILSTEELGVVRRFIYNLDNVHFFNDKEIEDIKSMIEEYHHSPNFRETVLFLVEIFKDDRDKDAITFILYVPKVFRWIGKFFAWARNVAILLIPLLVLSSYFSDKLKGLLELLQKI